MTAKSKFRKKIESLEDLNTFVLENMSDEEKDKLFEKGIKSRKWAERGDWAMGFYTVWCFAIGTVAIGFLAWKLIEWIYKFF